MEYNELMIERNMRDEIVSSVPAGEVFPYDDRSDAVISVVRLEEPYGPGSPAVVSVGSSLKGRAREPTWKVHIPLSLAPDVAAALLRAADVGEGDVREPRAARRDLECERG